jgi:putative Mg2+ transporter-C (MgtC) family protein
VQGIGFLGAGLILHNKNRVSGLASAASIFVVASIGMACGAGLFLPALIATVIVMVAMAASAFWSGKSILKSYPLIYEARGSDENNLLTPSSMRWTSSSSAWRRRTRRHRHMQRVSFSHLRHQAQA